MPTLVDDVSAAKRPQNREDEVKQKTRLRDEPSQEEIAALAYKLWEEHGHRHGSADENWLEAEQQLRE